MVMDMGRGCQNQKRFQIYDGLRYRRSYTSRRRAIQAINAFRRPDCGKYYKLIDRADNSSSLILPEVKKE